VSEQRSSSPRAFARRRILPPGRRELIQANDARDRRDWNTAAAEYQRHLRIRPNNFSIWVQLGHALKESGQPAQALAAYGEALRIDPQNADLLLNLGHLYKVMGLPGQAADFYRRSLAIDGNPHAAGELQRLAPGTASAIACRASGRKQSVNAGTPPVTRAIGRPPSRPIGSISACGPTTPRSGFSSAMP
jgi:tetratricopeptide (TPR) repeat protein